MNFHFHLSISNVDVVVIIITVIYRFYGQEKLVNWLIKKIEAV